MTDRDADLYADAKAENACFAAGHPTTSRGRCWCGTVNDATPRQPPPDTAA